MSKLLKVKPVKELLSWLKLLVSIKFKLSAVTVPELEISSAKLVTSIVKVSATIAPELFKVNSCCNTETFCIYRCAIDKVTSSLNV